MTYSFHCHRIDSPKGKTDGVKDIYNFIECGKCSPVQYMAVGVNLSCIRSYLKSQMAWSVKCFDVQAWRPKCDPQIPHKKLSVVAFVYSLSTRDVEIDNAWGLQSNHSQWETLSKATEGSWGMALKTDLWTLLHLHIHSSISTRTNSGCKKTNLEIKRFVAMAIKPLRLK